MKNTREKEYRATVGSYEAKTHLSKLLDRVAGGEYITITKHGRPVATLVPIEEDQQHRAEEAIAELKAFRVGKNLGDLTIRGLIEEGRRY